MINSDLNVFYHSNNILTFLFFPVFPLHVFSQSRKFFFYFNAIYLYTFIWFKVFIINSLRFYKKIKVNNKNVEIEKKIRIE